MAVVWIVLIVFAFLLVVFLVLALGFPEELKKLLGRMTSVEVTKDGLKIALIADAVQEKENRRPDVAELRPFVTDIPAGRRVLWVDDCPANNRVEIQALRSLGLTVDTATTNAEALSYARANKYDLVLTDIKRSSPERENAGLELPATLREAHLSAPVAFYVGKADNSTTGHGDPVFDTPTQLLGWVRDHLRDPSR